MSGYSLAFQFDRPSTNYHRPTCQECCRVAQNKPWVFRDLADHLRGVCSTPDMLETPFHLALWLLTVALVTEASHH
jgi:hypothetical protein